MSFFVFSTKKRSRTKQRTDNKHIIKPHQHGGEMQDEFMPPTSAQIKCITTKFRRIYSFFGADNQTIYLIGASLKDAGKKLFAFTQISAELITELKKKL